MARERNKDDGARVGSERQGRPLVGNDAQNQCQRDPWEVQYDAWVTVHRFAEVPDKATDGIGETAVVRCLGLDPEREQPRAESMVAPPQIREQANDGGESGGDTKATLT